MYGNGQLYPGTYTLDCLADKRAMIWNASIMILLKTTQLSPQGRGYHNWSLICYYKCVIFPTSTSIQTCSLNWCTYFDNISFFVLKTCALWCKFVHFGLKITILGKERFNILLPAIYLFGEFTVYLLNFCSFVHDCALFYHLPLEPEFPTPSVTPGIRITS